MYVKKIIFLLVTVVSSLIILILGFFLLYSQIKNISFSNYLKGCNSTSPKERFSCYRSGIEKYYKGDFSGFINKIKQKPAVLDNASYNYAIFGTNSHTFYHAAGDFIAENAFLTDIHTLLNFCPTTSTSGCMMGLYKRLTLKNNYSTDLIKFLYENCREEEKDQCAHEIGHILHDKYTYSILKIIDDISEKKYDLKQNTIYNYTTFKTGDLTTPFEECRVIILEDKGELDRCFTGIGHNLFLFSEFSPDGYKSIFNECAKIKESEKDNCFAFMIFRVGMNEASPRFLSNKVEEGLKVCEDVISMSGRKDLAFHCYVGIGGGIGLYVDSSYGSLEISAKKILSVKEDLLMYAKLCDKIPNQFKDYCYSGLLGTKFKKLYFQLDMYDSKIEEILPKIDKDFVVVG